MSFLRLPLLLRFALVSILASGCGRCGPEPLCGLCDEDAGPTDAGADGGDPPELPPCDDGNPCTRDTRGAVGCDHAPVADGTPCDDGDLCTLGDRCASAACVPGDRADGDLAAIGGLDAIGGRIVPLEEDAFLSVSIEDVLRGRLQRIARTPTGVEVVATWRGAFSYVVIDPSEILVGVGGSGLVAVGARGERGVRVFTVDDDSITARGAIAELSGQVATLTAHGSRIWLCTRDFFTGYRIELVDASDPDAPVDVGAIALGTTACGSLAANEDGSRVYVNTAAGVRVVDTTPLGSGGEPTLSDVIAPSAGVSVSDGRLLLASETGLRILDEASQVELATLPIARARAVTAAGDRLVVEGSRAAAGGTERFASLYDLSDPSAPTRLDDVVIGTHLGAPETSTYVGATDGRTLFAAAGLRAFDLTHDAIDELAAPALVPMNALARSATGLRVVDRIAAAAIDVSDPAHPSFAGGGVFEAELPVLGFGLDVSLPTASFVSGVGRMYGEDLTRVALDVTNPYYPSPLAVHRFRFDAQAGALGDDPFTLDHDGRTQLFVAGDAMYALRQPAASRLEVRLRRFPLDAIGAAGSRALADVDLVLPATTAGLRGVDVDPRARIAVVSTEMPGDDGSSAPALVVVDLAASPPAVIRTIPAAAVHPQLRVAGDHVVAIAADGYVSYDLTSGEVARMTTSVRWNFQLLAFDGRTAYVGQIHVEPGVGGYELMALPFGATTLGPILAVEALPKSLVALDDALAVGFETGLVTVRPQCAVAP